MIAAISVENGEVIHHRLGATLKEVDSADFIMATVAKLPTIDRVIILANQLDTHISETLIRWISEGDGEAVGKREKVAF